jgi:hypothetical protein
MAQQPILEWSGQEYAFEDRGTDWFWALGILSTAAVIAAVLFNNVLLAMVILAGSLAIGLQAAKKSRTHVFSLYDEGIAVDDTMYLFQNMRDFAVLEYIDESLPPALSLKTNHLLSPHLLIPITEHDPEEIYWHIEQRLPEGRHDYSLLDHVSALLKF